MNEYAIDGDVARMFLNRDQVALVDTEDIERLQTYHWCALWHEQTKSYYLVSNERTPGGGYCSRYGHRFIMGATKGQKVDHKNGKTLDCRKENMRIVTSSENMQNRTKGATARSSTGIRGVCYHRKSGRYRVQVKLHGKTYRGGEYPVTPEGLKLAGDRALELRLQLHTHSDGR